MNVHTCIDKHHVNVLEHLLIKNDITEAHHNYLIVDKY